MLLGEYLKWKTIKSRVMAAECGTSVKMIQDIAAGRRSATLELAKTIDRVTCGYVSRLEVLYPLEYQRYEAISGEEHERSQTESITFAELLSQTMHDDRVAVKPDTPNDPAIDQFGEPIKRGRGRPRKYPIKAWRPDPQTPTTVISETKK